MTCAIDMHFLPEKMEQAVRLLVSSVGSTEAKSGCRECLISLDATDASHARYTEVWDSESAFQRHLRSEEFRRVLIAMDMSKEEPQVVVGNLSGHSGIEHLRAIREKDDGK